MSDLRQPSIADWLGEKGQRHHPTPARVYGQPRSVTAHLREMTCVPGSFPTLVAASASAPITPGPIQLQRGHWKPVPAAGRRFRSHL